MPYNVHARIFVLIFLIDRENTDVSFPDRVYELRTVAFMIDSSINIS
jgi:hypothetical protein